MVIIHLPPQPSPKLLTAYKKIESLGEHAMAFLNANNRKSWAEYEPEEISELATVLGEMLAQRSFTRQELKQLNYHLRSKVITNVKMTRVYEMMGRFLGYKNWSDAAESSPNEGPIVNRNFGKSFTRVNQEATEKAKSIEPVIVSKANRLARRSSFEDFYKMLRAACSDANVDRLKKALKQAAENLFDGELPADWWHRHVSYSAFVDPVNPLTVWVIVEKSWHRIIPWKEYKTLAIKLELYPTSKSVKSIYAPELTDKTYAQWRFEYNQK